MTDCVAEARFDSPPPSCHVCGAQMVVKEFKCLSCGITSGVQPTDKHREATRETEYDHAIRLANKILDRVNADPDDDIAILARQFLRATEPYFPAAEAQADTGPTTTNSKTYSRGSQWDDQRYDSKTGEVISAEPQAATVCSPCAWHHPEKCERPVPCSVVAAKDARISELVTALRQIMKEHHEDACKPAWWDNVEALLANYPEAPQK